MCFYFIIRNGLVKDINDERTKPLLHIIENLIPKSESLKYILVENVKGFESSLARDKLVTTLSQSGFTYREFLLSPVHFGICNSRLRYYLLAKKKPLDFAISLQNDIVSYLGIILTKYILLCCTLLIMFLIFVTCVHFPIVEGNHIY